MADDGVDLNESIDGDGVDLDKTIDYDALDLDNSMNDDAIELYRSIDDDFMKVTGARKFSYEDLVSATNNFSENEKLGKGGFGSVYRGFLKELDCYVAVKRVSSDSEQGVKEYASEVKIISQLRHENIVQLMGWCHERKELVLVYEFMPNGSLDFHLFKDNSLLSWEMRYKIARGLASGLLYLHHKQERYVVHRDIKASNIMLDSSFTAKIGDFGLARLGDHGKGLEYTPLAGTVGYVALEYAITGRASKESDVYSFGIVALEIACGRKVIDRQAIREDQRNLREWVWDLYGKGKILEAADPRLDGEFDKQQVECLMMVGLWCAHPDPKLRPTIENAIHVLNFAAPVPDLPSEMPMFSYFGPFSSSSRSSITASSQGSKISGNNQFSGQILPTPILRIFSYAELGAATNKFITHAVADTRALGNVLKGRLDDEAPGKAGTGTLIAVKKLKYENLLGFKPWQSEVNFLGRLSHPNLVKLIGYCWEHKELQLVYEFMQNWSLEYQLSRRGSYFQPLPWDTRIKIAIGAARGLAFLHTLDMIHGNFKASNILLDGSYTAKISDFGLAKFEASDSDDFPYLVTRVMGNYGCAAPEYVATGHLYKKSDVYGFGVVLMEILTGLRAYDRNRPYVERNLVNWIKPYLYDKRKLNCILDSRLEGTYPLKAAVLVAQLALNCIESVPNRRPSMKEVVETLERIAATTDRPMVPRVRSNRSATHHHGHQPSQHRSPPHPRQDENRAYQQSRIVRYLRGLN